MTITRKNFLVPPKETYFCEHCGAEVKGGRYNNHCPHCLWSKHLDQDVPGDRRSLCHGRMEPIGVTQTRGTWRIMQQCQTCGKKFTVDRAKDDSVDVMIALSQSPLPE